MKNKLALILFLAVASQAAALTTNERQLVRTARQEIAAGIAKFGEMDAKLQVAGLQATEAAQRALEAEQNAQAAQDSASETGRRIETLSSDIDKAQKRADALATENAKMKPVYDRVHKWFGLGAIFFGLGLLAKNVFILVAVGGVALLVASFFLPVIGVVVGRLWRSILGLFHRKS